MGRANPFYKQGHAPAGCVVFYMPAIPGQDLYYICRDVIECPYQAPIHP